MLEILAYLKFSARNSWRGSTETQDRIDVVFNAITTNTTLSSALETASLLARVSTEPRHQPRHEFRPVNFRYAKFFYD
jgi:hypothetical protein